MNLLPGESEAAFVGVRMILAPNNLSTSAFSVDIFSGITMMHLYPLTAAANARPMPVLPVKIKEKDQ